MADVISASESRLRATDTGLPFLAAQAAVELKMFSDGKRIDLPSVVRLSDLISNSVDLQQDTSPRSLMDPSTVSIMSQALEDSQWSEHRPQTLGDLAKLASQLAKEMRSPSGAKSRNGDLKRMMDFCVALARYSSIYRKSVLSQRRKHPYRS